MKLKNMFIITAVFFLVNSVIALLAPAMQLSIYGVTSGPGEKYMAQWAGLGSIAICSLAWLSRNVTDPKAQRANNLTLLIYFSIGFFISLLGTLSGVMNVMGWSLVIIYVLFAAGYAFFLFGKTSNS